MRTFNLHYNSKSDKHEGRFIREMKCVIQPHRRLKIMLYLIEKQRLFPKKATTFKML